MNGEILFSEAAFRTHCSDAMMGERETRVVVTFEGVE